MIKQYKKLILSIGLCTTLLLGAEKSGVERGQLITTVASGFYDPESVQGTILNLGRAADLLREAPNCYTELCLREVPRAEEDFYSLDTWPGSLEIVPGHDGHYLLAGREYLVLTNGEKPMMGSPDELDKMIKEARIGDKWPLFHTSALDSPANMIRMIADLIRGKLGLVDGEAPNILDNQYINVFSSFRAVEFKRIGPITLILGVREAHMSLFPVDLQDRPPAYLIVTPLGVAYLQGALPPEHPLRPTIDDSLAWRVRPVRVYQS